MAGTCGNCGMSDDPEAGGHSTNECSVFKGAGKNVTPSQYIREGEDLDYEKDTERRRGRR